MKAIEILNRCRAADAEISRIRQRIEQRNSALYRITASPMDANGGSRASGNHDKIGTLEADIDTLQRQMLARKRAKQVEIAAACALLDYLDAASSDVLYRFYVLGETAAAIEKAFDGEPVKNVMIARYDISYIEKVFAPEDRVERIYINFCNPWTKRPKYAKRRLTHPRQLMQYREFLVDGGEIWFKTDDDALFEESMPYFDACGFELRYQTGDLHAAGVTPNYVSEHEMKFTALGVPIKFARFAKKPGKVELDPVRWVMPGAFAKLREDDETEEP